VEQRYYRVLLHCPIPVSEIFQRRGYWNHTWSKFPLTHSFHRFCIPDFFPKHHSYGTFGWIGSILRSREAVQPQAIEGGYLSRDEIRADESPALC
jgi:hypothetical protein